MRPGSWEGSLEEVTFKASLRHARKEEHSREKKQLCKVLEARKRVAEER